MSESPQKIIIAAMDANRLIGDGDQLPWKIPQEYQQFLSFISNQSVIVGRKTFEIFSKLPSARTFVITHQDKRYDNAQICHSFAEALKAASAYPETIFIAGGAVIYKEALHVADKMYLSFIKGEFSGDTYFPAFDSSQWTIESRTYFPEFEFVVFSRKGETNLRRLSKESL